MLIGPDAVDAHNGTAHPLRYCSSQVAIRTYDVSFVAAAHLVYRYYAFDSIFAARLVSWASVLELRDSLDIVLCAVSRGR